MALIIGLVVWGLTSDPWWSAFGVGMIVASFID